MTAVSAFSGSALAVANPWALVQALQAVAAELARSESRFRIGGNFAHHLEKRAHMIVVSSQGQVR